MSHNNKSVSFWLLEKQYQTISAIFVNSESAMKKLANYSTVVGRQRSSTLPHIINRAFLASGDYYAKGSVVQSSQL